MAVRAIERNMGIFIEEARAFLLRGICLQNIDSRFGFESRHQYICLDIPHRGPLFWNMIHGAQGAKTFDKNGLLRQPIKRVVTRRYTTRYLSAKAASYLSHNLIHCYEHFCFYLLPRTVFCL